MSRNTFAISMLFALAGATTARAEGTSAFAWVQGGTGTFEAHARYRNVPTSVRRATVGVYEVRMRGVGELGGNVQVNAYGAGARCQIASWYPSGSDLLANVRCHRGTAAADSAFSIGFVRADLDAGSRGLSYLFGGSRSASVYLPASYQDDPTGRHTVSRFSPGNYVASLATTHGPNGHVAVTSYGTRGELCTVGGTWSASGRVNVSVRCFSSAGTPVDSLFTLRYEAATPTTSDAWAFAYASRASDAIYAPPSAQSYARTGAPYARRLGVGFYAMDLPGVLPTRGIPLVSAYGSTPVACAPTSWWPNETGTTVYVRCANAGGAPVDARYSVGFRNAPVSYRVVGQESDRTPVLNQTWSGFLLEHDPRFVGRLEAIDLRTRLGTIRDSWFRMPDGSLSKIVVDRGRTPRGALNLRADGTTTLSVDLDGDRYVDIVETTQADGSWRVLAAEGDGVDAIASWLAGSSPLCTGVGPDGVVAEDVLHGYLPGCDLESAIDMAADVASWAPAYGNDGPIDPLDTMCAHLTNARPEGFDPGLRASDGQITRATGDAVREILNNGFDGEPDSGAVVAARAIASPLVVGYVLLFAFYTDQLTDLAVHGPLPSTSTETTTMMERTETEETQAEAPPEETPVDPEGGDETRPAEGDDSDAWERMCRGRRDNTRESERYRDALDARCDDPDAVGGTMVCDATNDPEIVDVLHPAVDATVGCDDGDPASSRGCEPETVAERLRWMEQHQFEGLEICNPMVCQPL